MESSKSKPYSAIFVFGDGGELAVALSTNFIPPSARFHPAVSPISSRGEPDFNRDASPDCGLGSVSAKFKNRASARFFEFSEGELEERRDAPPAVRT